MDTSLAPSSEDESELGMLIREGELRETGNLAAWTVSSAKAGFEIDNVRDDSCETFWQYVQF